MRSEIVKTLELMCDKTDPQDRKLLLLAELVESRYDDLEQKQDDLKEGLDNAVKKMDKLTTLLENYSISAKGCPVRKNREAFEFVAVLLKRPKLFSAFIIGVVVLIFRAFGGELVIIIKELLK